MLNKIIKYSFTAVGAFTGFTAAKVLLSIQGINISLSLKIVIFVISAITVGFLFYSSVNKVIEALLRVFDKIESALRKLTLYELLVCAGGLIAGLIVANLVTISINRIFIIGVPLSIFTNILFGCIGVSIAATKKSETLFDMSGNKKGNLQSRYDQMPKILDTSVIIDGRIVDICRAGFIEGELIVPGFVLHELRHIADSPDTIKRNRGRRGLDVLNMLQTELEHPVKIENYDVSDSGEVDDKLLKIAKKNNGKIITIDYNLNKVACFQGVPVLNINELANSVKPIALPGEEMVVQIIKDGKENGQGVGYLEDGTMIVVDGGRKHIGETVNVIVTSVLQTAAGRMIFAKQK